MSRKKIEKVSIEMAFHYFRDDMYGDAGEQQQWFIWNVVWRNIPKKETEK
jgi:hypothetical protein